MAKTLLLALIVGVGLGIFLVFVTRESLPHVPTKPIVVEDCDGIILIDPLSSSNAFSPDLSGKTSILVQDGTGAYAKTLKQPHVAANSFNNEPQMVMIQGCRAVHSGALAGYSNIEEIAASTDPSVIIEHALGSLGIELESTNALCNAHGRSSPITIEHSAGITGAAMARSSMLATQTWSSEPSITVEHARSIIDGHFRTPVWIGQHPEQ